MKRYPTVSALHMHSHSPGLTMIWWWHDQPRVGWFAKGEHSYRRPTRSGRNAVDNDDTQFCDAGWWLLGTWPTQFRPVTNRIDSSRGKRRHLRLSRVCTDWRWAARVVMILDPGNYRMSISQVGSSNGLTVLRGVDWFWVLLMHVWNIFPNPFLKLLWAIHKHM